MRRKRRIVWWLPMVNFCNSTCGTDKNTSSSYNLRFQTSNCTIQSFLCRSSWLSTKIKLKLYPCPKTTPWRLIECGDIAPRFLKLDSSRTFVVSFTVLGRYLRCSNWVGDWVSPTAGLDLEAGKNISFYRDSNSSFRPLSNNYTGRACP